MHGEPRGKLMVIKLVSCSSGQQDNFGSGEGWWGGNVLAEEKTLYL